MNEREVEGGGGVVVVDLHKGKGQRRVREGRKTEWDGGGSGGGR